MPHMGQGCWGSCGDRAGLAQALLGGYPLLSTQQARSEQQASNKKQVGSCIIWKRGGLLGSQRVDHPGPDYQNFGDPTQVPAPIWGWEPWALGAELLGSGWVLNGQCFWKNCL